MFALVKWRLTETVKDNQIYEHPTSFKQIKTCISPRIKLNVIKQTENQRYDRWRQKKKKKKKWSHFDWIQSFASVYQTSVANVEIHKYMREVVVDHLVGNSLASISRTKPKDKTWKCWLWNLYSTINNLVCTELQNQRWNK